MMLAAQRLPATHSVADHSTVTDTGSTSTWGRGRGRRPTGQWASSGSQDRCSLSQLSSVPDKVPRLLKLPSINCASIGKGPAGHEQVSALHAVSVAVQSSANMCKRA